MRAAANHEDVIRQIRQQAGVEVEIIAPSRETDFSFEGVLLDNRDLHPDLLFEVGGGSVQVAAIAAEKIEQHISLPLGTGRVIANSGLANPCPPECILAAQQFIDSVISAATLPRLPAKPRAVASGGVARGLWRALHPDGEKRLYREELDYLIWSSSRLNVDRVINRFNVKARRAGTLLPGAMVYRTLMERFNLAEIFVSEFGVREGAVLEMARGKIERCPV
jgi:exopolyphosphatase/guanosine-5'-triphosphate,3'-diphosphate pyrophosphatase